MINKEKAQLLAKIGQLALSLQQASMVNLAPYQWYIERQIDKAQELLYALQILEIPVSFMAEDDEIEYEDPEYAVLIGKEVSPNVIIILASVLKDIYGEQGIGMYLSYAWVAPEMVTSINIGYVIDRERPYQNLSKRFEPADVLSLPLSMMTLSEFQSHFPNLVPNKEGWILACLPYWQQEIFDQHDRKRKEEESAEMHDHELRKESDSWMDNDDDYWNID